MSDDDEDQRFVDVCCYGLCQVPGCREPRRAEIVDDPSHQGGKLSRLICYAGHLQT